MLERLVRLVSKDVEVYPKDPLREAAVTALIVPTDVLNILFIRRKIDINDPWSGQVALPGGRFKMKDRTLLNTAIREMFEEVGIRLSRSNYIGHIGYFSPKNIPEIRVLAYIAILNHMPDVRAGSEVREAFWVSIDELKSNVEEVVLNLPSGRVWKGLAYKVNGRVIWGMTARIVSSILSLI